MSNQNTVVESKKSVGYWKEQYARQSSEAGIKAVLNLSRSYLSEQDYKEAWSAYHSQMAVVRENLAKSNKDIRSEAGRYILTHIASAQALSVIYACVANMPDATPFGVPPQSEYPAIWRAWHACHKRPVAPKTTVQDVAFV